MNSPITKLLLAATVAASLSACASFTDEKVARFDTLERIHAGLTPDEVRDIAGAPTYTGHDPRTGETQWTYHFSDEWGYASDLAVDFDKASGRVVEASALREGDH